MTLDFPANPSDGQVFDAPNSVRYIWSAASGLWLVQALASPAPGWRVLQRTVVSVAVANVNIQNIPSDVNEIDVHFDLLPVTNNVDLYCQFYGATGVLDTTPANYTWLIWQMAALAAGGTSPTGTGGTATSGIPVHYLSVTNAAGYSIKGHFKVPGIRNATTKAILGQSSYVGGAGTGLHGATFSGYRSVVEPITGLNLSFSSGNIASGSFTVWGSP